MTMYTELLEAAMILAKEAEELAPTEEDRLEWRHLNKVCQLEMYKTRGKIHDDRRKSLTRIEDTSTIELQHSDARDTQSVDPFKQGSNYD